MAVTEENFMVPLTLIATSEMNDIVLASGEVFVVFIGSYLVTSHLSLLNHLLK